MKTPHRQRTSPLAAEGIDRVGFEGGFVIRGTPLRFDASVGSELSFLSHAHVVVRHKRIVASDATARFYRAEFGRSDVLTVPFGRPFSLGRLELELVPSGHMLGAAQLLVAIGQVRYLYVSGLQTMPTATAEPLAIRPTDVLLLNCPYDAGLVLPPRAREAARLVDWVEGVLGAGQTPALFATPLGNAQELMHLLGAAGFRLRVHPRIGRYARVYREAGVRLPPAPSLRGAPPAGEVILLPTQQLRSATVRRFARLKTALVSGRAAQPAEVRAAGVDAAFRLSDHADSAGLLDFVRRTSATEVALGPMHGAPFAERLERLGLRVRRFGPPAQLGLWERQSG